MPQWDSKKFEESATKIAREFNSNGGDLHALTVKTAKEQGLNQEQIRRLGRAVNVKAFEQKFASLKGAKDRIVDFDPVDPESVIGTLFNASEASEKPRGCDLPGAGGSDEGRARLDARVRENGKCRRTRRALWRSTQRSTN
jgi:hypothetical protein